MNPKVRLCGCVLVLMASACQTTSAQADQPALLSNPGAEVGAELSAAIGHLAGFAKVTLAERDFTTSSVLVVERRHQFDNKGELIQGRDLEMPQRFRLLTNSAGQCWLLHEKSGQRSLLAKARCRPE